ncbi:MAG: HEPN domain-containing protein [Planctomycetota bacterium]
MSEQHDTVRQIRQWVEKAEHDLAASEHLLRLSGQELADVVCYHCQQCAEKYLKVLLSWHRVHFPKTHDLRLLLDLVPPNVSLGLQRTEVIPLNRYMIEGRYPGEWEPITEDEAESALDMARGVRRAVRACLPEESLK